MLPSPSVSFLPIKTLWSEVTDSGTLPNVCIVISWLCDNLTCLLITVVIWPLLSYTLSPISTSLIALQYLLITIESSWKQSPCTCLYNGPKSGSNFNKDLNGNESFPFPLPYKS